LTADAPWVATLSMRNATSGSRRRAFSADAAGQERQRPLAVGGEQPLGGEQFLERLEPGQEFTEPDLTDLRRPQAQRAPLDVEVRAGPHHDAGALVDRVAENAAGAGHGERDVGVRVAQRQELGGHAGAPGHLGDLTVDPDLAQPGDPLPDPLRDDAHRNGLVGRGLEPCHG
jgi:hypothetical protein